MKFNKLINSLLKEEDLSDREKRIQALRSAKMSAQFRVISATGTYSILREVGVRSEPSIEVAAEGVKADAISKLIANWTDDPLEGSVEDYIALHVGVPCYNRDHTIAMLRTEEEVVMIIISAGSPFFESSLKEINERYDEVCGDIDTLELYGWNENE